MLLLLLLLLLQMLTNDDEDGDHNNFIKLCRVLFCCPNSGKICAMCRFSPINTEYSF
jgi:hypothetical protein